MSEADTVPFQLRAERIGLSVVTGGQDRKRTVISETSDNVARAENYRSNAALVREMADDMPDKQRRFECLELAASWEALARRLEDLAR